MFALSDNYIILNNGLQQVDDDDDIILHIF